MKDIDAKPDIRTPVSVLTGFLGSGKTTLLNKALPTPGMEKTLVIINEFGAVGIDHLLVSSSSDSVVVLENGCLCCTVFGDLVGTLSRLYHAREAGEIAVFDHVVIETSGLAEPRQIIQAFLSDPVLQGLYRLSSVICVVDAINAISTLERHDESVRQLALADTVLVTKLDLLDDDKVQGSFDNLLGRIRSINPAASVCRCDELPVTLGEIFRENHLTMDPGRISAGRWLKVDAYLPVTSHTHRSSITAYCTVREEPVSLYALELLLSSIERNLGESLLRVKGLVNVKEEPDRPAVVHGAQHLLHNLEWMDRWPDDDHRTRLVFITDGMSKQDLEEMVSMLERIAVRTAAARDRAVTQDPS